MKILKYILIVFAVVVVFKNGEKVKFPDGDYWYDHGWGKLITVKGPYVEKKGRPEIATLNRAEIQSIYFEGAVDT